jgi:AraC family transcriptional regulator
MLDRRIERATELLARPDHSLLDVAQLTGFQTQQHFSRVFRQRIGISPGAFRHAG